MKRICNSPMKARAGPGTNPPQSLPRHEAFYPSSPIFLGVRHGLNAVDSHLVPISLRVFQQRRGFFSPLLWPTWDECRSCSRVCEGPATVSYNVITKPFSPTENRLLNRPNHKVGVFSGVRNTEDRKQQLGDDGALAMSLSVLSYAQPVSVVLEHRLSVLRIQTITDLLLGNGDVIIK
ncbi:hypothetical protein LY78DRAFT_392302 [Colletotrichum sublineola]|nr:hypothetical protein LY78DRAFT_392302 [Colletotrichum sublineola]